MHVHPSPKLLEAYSSKHPPAGAVCWTPVPHGQQKEEDVEDVDEEGEEESPEKDPEEEEDEKGDDEIKKPITPHARMVAVDLISSDEDEPEPDSKEVVKGSKPDAVKD